MVVDVAGFGDESRTDRHRMTVRDGLYRILAAGFDEAGVPLERCRRRDSGDGVLIMLPPDIPKIELVDRLPHRIAAGLRRHNGDHSEGARVRLRMALHAGEIREDPNGFVGEAVNFTFRILDALEAKRALKSSLADFVLIVSDWFYRSVVMNDPAAEPDGFREIDVSVKETQAKAWIRLIGGQPGVPAARSTARRDEAAGLRDPTLAELGTIVDVLIHTPGFVTRHDRDLVLAQLDSNVTSVIARYPAARADITSIVRACQHYHGAWEKLIEAIRFFANGSDAMHALDRLLAESGQARARE